MAQGSTELREAPQTLEPETFDRRRAIVSLMKELEAVDWHDQRVEAAVKADLRAILAHNRDEEKAHAAMVLERLGRRDARFDEDLCRYVFSEGPIEGHADHDSGGSRRISLT